MPFPVNDYAILNAINPETGHPLGFSGYEYLLQPLNDESPRIILQKGAQVGATVLAMLRTLWFVDVRKAHTLYLFPTHRSAERFSRGRLGRLIACSPKLRALFQGGNHQHRRAAGVNLYCHGARSRVELMAMPIQKLILDERDEMYWTDPHGRHPWSAVELARQRLSGQREHWELDLSTPTVPEHGIARDYVRSDRHEYMLRCPHCQRFGPMRWPESMQWDEGQGHPERSARYCCLRCRRAWSEAERQVAITLGCWVPAEPHVTVRGYHLPQLLSPAATPQRIVQTWLDAQDRPAALQLFHNVVLGMPYIAEGARLSQANIEAAQQRGGGYRQDAVPRGPLVLGADIGPTWLHVVWADQLGDCLRVLGMAQMESWERLGELVQRLRVAGFVVDAQPETHQARRFLQQYPQGWMCYYRSTMDGMALDAAGQKVVVNRTESLDSMYHRFRDGSMLLPMDLPMAFVLQLQSLVRLLRVNRQGQAVAEYLESGAADHYAHALNYCHLASQLLGQPRRFEVTLPSREAGWLAR